MNEIKGMKDKLSQIKSEFLDNIVEIPMNNFEVS